MFQINEDDISPQYDSFRQRVKDRVTFAVTGLTTFLRLFLLSKVQKQNPTIFITSTEQNALKYQSDLKTIFNLDAQIMPFQDVSMYEPIDPNLYDYASQVNLLLNKPKLIICPVKAMLEKFPNTDFFKKNSIKFKIGDSIDLGKLAKRLVNLGYKKVTMVNDIGGFSIRGDIADIFSLNQNPVRIELWGDEIVDIRYFNNETQKSVEKAKETKIYPLYKFITSGQDELVKELQYTKENEDEIPEDNYFEGISVYQNYFNEHLTGLLDYFKDYTLVFDEASEIYSKYEFLDDEAHKRLDENLKQGIIKNPSANVKKLKNHFTYEEFLRQTSYFQKIGFNNFIDGEMTNLLEFDARPLRNFEANIKDLTKFIKEHRNYKIIVATNYPDRVREILEEEDIFDVTYADSIVCGGCILENFKTIIITDREMFNKRDKEITTARRSYYKEKPEFIENINDIKPENT